MLLECPIIVRNTEYPKTFKFKKCPKFFLTQANHAIPEFFPKEVASYPQRAFGIVHDLLDHGDMKLPLNVVGELIAFGAFAVRLSVDNRPNLIKNTSDNLMEVLRQGKLSPSDVLPMPPSDYEKDLHLLSPKTINFAIDLVSNGYFNFGEETWNNAIDLTLYGAILAVKRWGSEAKVISIYNVLKNKIDLFLDKCNPRHPMEIKLYDDRITMIFMNRTEEYIF